MYNRAGWLASQHVYSAVKVGIIVEAFHVVTRSHLYIVHMMGFRRIHPHMYIILVLY
jgi:hypothetical protein